MGFLGRTFNFVQFQRISEVDFSTLFMFCKSKFYLSRSVPNVHRITIFTVDFMDLIQLIKSIGLLYAVREEYKLMVQGISVSE